MVADADLDRTLSYLVTGVWVKQQPDALGKRALNEHLQMSSESLFEILV